jgi:integrase
MRGCDLRTGGPVWLYAPARHKNSWRGQALVKAIPQAAQTILLPYMRTDLEAYLFSPRDAEVRRTGRAVRDQVREHYDTYTYRRAITRACEIAFDMPKHLRRISPKLKPEDQQRLREEAAAWRAAHCWTPNQLRHAIATEISQTIGQQAAQRWLGHADLNTTAIYAENEAAELIAIAQELDRRWAS